MGRQRRLSPWLSRPPLLNRTFRAAQAEADYWRRGEGYRLGWSDELLGFDCGGQQWVLEVALPAGTLAQPDGKDIAYMEDLLKLVKQQVLGWL